MLDHRSESFMMRISLVLHLLSSSEKDTMSVRNLKEHSAEGEQWGKRDEGNLLIASQFLEAQWEWIDFLLLVTSIANRHGKLNRKWSSFRGGGPTSCPVVGALVAHPKQHRILSLNFPENSALRSIYHAHSGLNLIHNILVVLDWTLTSGSRMNVLSVTILWVFTE